MKKIIIAFANLYLYILGFISVINTPFLFGKHPKSGPFAINPDLAMLHALRNWLWLVFIGFILYIVKCALQNKITSEE